jgi:hypothetical protein
MENSEECIKKYILSSKQFINKLIYDNEHRKAFNMLITVLGHLDETGIQELIKYYNNNHDICFK